MDSCPIKLMFCVCVRMNYIHVFKRQYSRIHTPPRMRKSAQTCTRIHTDVDAQPKTPKHTHTHTAVHMDASNATPTAQAFSPSAQSSAPQQQPEHCATASPAAGSEKVVGDADRKEKLRRARENFAAMEAAADAADSLSLAQVLHNVRRVCLCRARTSVCAYAYDAAGNVRSF